MEVHVSCNVAQTATETRKESWAVMEHKSPGRGHDGDMSEGSVDKGIEEKSRSLLDQYRFSAI